MGSMSPLAAIHIHKSDYLRTSSRTGSPPRETLSKNPPHISKAAGAGFGLLPSNSSIYRFFM